MPALRLYEFYEKSGLGTGATLKFLKYFCYFCACICISICICICQAGVPALGIYEFYEKSGLGAEQLSKVSKVFLLLFSHVFVFVQQVCQH